MGASTSRTQPAKAARRPTSLSREHVAAVDRREDFERLAAARRGDAVVEALAAVARREQGVVGRAHVEAPRRLRGGGAPDRADRQAFEAASVRRQLRRHRHGGDLRARGRRGARRGRRLVGHPGDVRVEGGEFGRPHECDQAERFELGVVVHQARPAGPALEFGGAALGVLRQVGARGREHPVLVGESELDGAGGAGRGVRESGRARCRRSSARRRGRRGRWRRRRRGARRARSRGAARRCWTATSANPGPRPRGTRRAPARRRGRRRCHRPRRARGCGPAARRGCRRRRARARRLGCRAWFCRGSLRAA